MKLKIILKQLVFFIILSAFSNNKIYSQCFQIESILVDACDDGTNEGFNEMVRFKVGAAPINTSSLTVNWASANLWQGLISPGANTNPKVALLNAQITASGGCGQLIEPSGGVLPANAKVVLVTSYNFDVALNYFGAITENIYIIFQDNPLVKAGHFGNYNTPAALRTLSMSFGSCSDSVTYERSLLVNVNGTHGGSSALNNGATVNFAPDGTPTYLNNGCVAPVDVFSVDAGSSPITACAGATIALSGTAQGQQSVAWTATSGSFSSPSSLITNYTIDPAATGSIVLTLTATNLCSKTKPSTVTVNISSGPAPSISCGTITSSSLQFTWPAVVGATGYSVSYQIGTGTPTALAPIGNVLNYTVNSLASGTDVTITVLPTGGVGTCFVSASNLCTTTGCIPPVLTITNPSAVCTPATVDITLPAITSGSTGAGTLTYWNDAAATNSLANPAIINTGGTYYIKSTSGACSDIQPVTVTITTNPVLTITSPAVVCSPATVDLTLPAVTSGSTGAGALTYWTDATATTTLANPSAISVSGTYYIKSTSGTCSDIKPVTVAITTSPVLTITNPAAVCSTANVDITLLAITNGSTGAGVLTYWNDAAATNSLANPATINTGGTYYIKSTSGTCSDIKPVTVTITTSPVLTITNPAAVCSPAAVDITLPVTTSGSTGAGTLTYWRDAAATNALANPTTINASGTYYVKSTSGICSDIKPVVVTVIPGIDFETSGNCVNGSYIIEAKPLLNSFDGTKASYQWKDSLGNNVGNNEATLNVSNLLASTPVIEEFPLTYNLTVTSVDGCDKTKSSIIYGAFCSIPKGISPDNDNKNDEFDLTGLGVKQLNIFNRYGTEVYNFTNYTKEWHGQTNGGQELPDGTYFYSIHKVDGTSLTGWVYINRKQ